MLLQIGMSLGAGTRAPASPLVFLLAGQSNMIGRAGFDGGAAYPAGTLQWTQAGALAPAASPLDHVDEDPGDMGLALQFAIEKGALPPLILVPAARSSTGFSDNRWNPGDDNRWNPGDDLYAAAVSRTNAVMAANPSFTFGGILWHQGEKDSQASGPAAAYQAKLDAMLTAMRGDITAATATTPIVLGRLLPAVFAKSGYAFAGSVDAVIADTPNRVPFTAVASAAGLTSGTGTGAPADDLHFDAPSLRTLGTRYAAALGAAAANAPAVPDQVTGLTVTPGGAAAANAPAVPDQVTGLTVTPGDTENALAWSAPAANHSPIGDYVIEVSVNGGATWAVVADGTGTATGATHTGLTNGLVYTYRVAAVNGIGTGPASATAAGTPALPPGRTVTAFAHAESGSTPATRTFTFPGLTVAAGSVVVGVCGRGSPDGAVASVTVGGVGATRIGNFQENINDIGLWIAEGVTGTSASIVVDWGSGNTVDRCGVAAWSVSGAPTAADCGFAASGASGTGISSRSATIDVAADGLLLAYTQMVLGGSNPQVAAWTGVTGRLAGTAVSSGFNHAAADHAVTADQTGRTVTATYAAAYNYPHLVLAHIAPE